MKKPFTSENAREMQKKSAESRIRNKQVSQILRDELLKKVGDMTKLEYLTQKAIINAKDDITLKDLKLIQDILGESVTNLNIDTTEGMTKEEYIAMIKEARK